MTTALGMPLFVREMNISVKKILRQKQKILVVQIVWEAREVLIAQIILSCHNGLGMKTKRRARRYSIEAFGSVGEHGLPVGNVIRSPTASFMPNFELPWKHWLVRRYRKLTLVQDFRFKFFHCFMYVCFACNMPGHPVHVADRKGFWFPRTRNTDYCYHPSMWVLKIEPTSSTRATSVFNYWTSSLATQYNFGFIIILKF